MLPLECCFLVAFEKISLGCFLEGMMLKLKLQYFGHLMRRVDSLERTLMLGGIRGRRRRARRRIDGWMASQTQWMWVWVNSGRCWWTGRPDMLWFMGSQSVGHDWATELNWTKLTPSQVDLPNPVIKLRSPALQADSLPTEFWGKLRWDEWREQHGSIYTTICKLDSPWQFSVWLRELKPGLCNNLEEWERVGCRVEVQEWGDICILMANSC